MNDARNKYGVEVGQVWRDNDERLQRSFKILSVDLDYYPGGRAECQLVEGLTKVGQRPVFYARLVRFNGNKRGYSLVTAAPDGDDAAPARVAGRPRGDRGATAGRPRGGAGRKAKKKAKAKARP